MISEFCKVYISHFRPNPRYLAHNGWNRWKIVFWAVIWPFLAFFEKSKNQFFVEYSTGVEISTVKFSEKKLMMFVDIHNKYLELTLISYEDIQKVKLLIFFQPHGRRRLFSIVHCPWAKFPLGGWSKVSISKSSTENTKSRIKVSWAFWLPH